MNGFKPDRKEFLGNITLLPHLWVLYTSTKLVLNGSEWMKQTSLYQFRWGYGKLYFFYTYIADEIGFTANFF